MLLGYSILGGEDVGGCGEDADIAHLLVGLVVVGLLVLYVLVDGQDTLCVHDGGSVLVLAGGVLGLVRDISL